MCYDLTGIQGSGLVYRAKRKRLELEMAAYILSSASKNDLKVLQMSKQLVRESIIWYLHFARRQSALSCVIFHM